MVRHQFPELLWLKALIQSRKAAGVAAWPTVILHVRQHQELRPDIEGPYSLFLNLSGSSRLSVDGHWNQLRDDAYLLTNRQQVYSLELDNKIGETETFNIHFGDAFSQEALHCLLHTADQLLDNPDPHAPQSLHFANHTHYRTAVFDHLIKRLHQHSAAFDQTLFEEDLFALFAYLCSRQQKEQHALKGLSVQKSSTRKEIGKRLSHALNYIHESYASPLTLDDLAATACLSKFHFLRLFRQAFGKSPNQYVQEVRLARTCTLLARTHLPLAEIAEQVGIQNASSLSRLVRQHIGRSPSQLRAQN